MHKYLLPILALAAPALAQSGGAFSITRSTIDGGGLTLSSGGVYTLAGTIGQHDAGAHAQGAYLCQGGFWTAASPSGPGFCYPNCDQSTVDPILNVADFTCFLQKFAAADVYANCDASTTDPVLNVADFTCFLQRFALGCP